MRRAGVDLLRERPLLDIASFGRRAPQGPIQFGRADIELVRRTARRVPEVMIKISGGGVSVKQVAEHIRYIQRNGKLQLEMESGEKLQGKGARHRLIEDWDLDLERAHPPGRRTGPARSPRLVHNIIFSMPPGTPPNRLLAAVSDFADREWNGRHRYAMVLHTDTSHPHVHVVVKAISELGERLNPDPATLREWRALFAERLRAHGVAANATERAVRGARRPPKRDGRYWAERRGASSRQREQMYEIARTNGSGSSRNEGGRLSLETTRKAVFDGWMKTAEMFKQAGDAMGSEDIRKFLGTFTPVRTERELLAEEWTRHLSRSKTEHANRLER